MQLLSKEHCLDFFSFFFCTKASLMNNKNFCKLVSSCVSFFLLAKDLVGGSSWLLGQEKAHPKVSLGIWD